MPLLAIRGLTKDFGGVRALDHVDLDVEEGQIVGVIGPNGAGKTTLFDVITGMVEADEGEVRLDGTSLSGLRPNQIVEVGVARTFQTVRLFPEMTVRENVMVARHCRTRSGLARAILRTAAFRREEADTTRRAEEALALFGDRLVGHRLDMPARSLSFANRRRLEIARALASGPKLLLLDEPTAGMNPHETHDLALSVARLRDRLDLTILLIEHDMPVVQGVSDHVVVLDFGRKIAEGGFEAVASDERVVDAYLGPRPVEP